MAGVDITSIRISEDLEQTLADPELGLLFRQFLKDVYAGESLSFWATIEAFHEITEQEEIDKKAKDIYQKFFSPESDYELNVDSRTKNNLIAKIQKDPPYDITIFDEVQKKVYNLMETDCYSKFIVSKPYKAYLELQKESASQGSSPTQSPKPGKKSLLSSLFRKKSKDKDKEEVVGRPRSASAAPSPSTSPSSSPGTSPSTPRRGVDDAGLDEGMFVGISMSFGKKDYTSETIRGLEMYRKRSGSRLPMPVATQFTAPTPLERSSSAVL